MKLDLTGQTFGYWTVLKEVEPNKHGQTQWLCKCKCGTIRVKTTNHLRTGRSKSCGCYKREVSTNDLTNKKFTKLLVIGDSGKRNINREIIWKCQCDCGNIVYVNTSHLTSNHTKSCGCLTKSKGVLNIIDVLTKNNIDFELEKTFQNCRFQDSNRMAKFDFYLPQYNTIIEFDGQQHFIPISYWGGAEGLCKIIEHDTYKNQYCKDNNIFLIRIPYNHIDIKLEDLLPLTSKFII